MVEEDAASVKESVVDGETVDISDFVSAPTDLTDVMFIINPELIEKIRVEKLPEIN